MEEFLPSFPNAWGRITWRDMLCITPLKAGLPVRVRQLFSFCRCGKWSCYSYKFKFFIGRGGDGGRRSKFWFRKDCWTFLGQITFPPHPLPLVTDKAETTTCFSISATSTGNTALRAEANRSLEGTQLQLHFLISLEFSLVENYNTRFIKKFSQLKQWHAILSL